MIIIREMNMEKKEDLLNVKNDYVFKRIFGREENKEITESLLKSILNENITDIELDNNTILDKDLIDEKFGIVDINAKINGTIKCDIEVQVIDKKNIEKRMLFYWTKLYTANFKSGTDYSKLKKTIVIMILDYNLSSIKEIPKYLTKWKLREDDFPKYILTHDMEFCIIELPKVKQYQGKTKNRALNYWVNFIESPGDVNMENEKDEELKKAIDGAKQVLDDISQNEHDRWMAELRAKYISDQKAIEDAGYDKGLEARNS